MEAVAEYHQHLLETPKAVGYLVGRKLSRGAWRRFGLGYFDKYATSPFHDRLMIPVRDQYGGLLSFQGRALYDYNSAKRPKYYHASFDKGSVLYGLYENAEQLLNAEFVVVTEGPLDVIALWDAGVPAVALMGSTFSAYQAYLLRRYTQSVVLWLDADAAGNKAAQLVTAQLKKLSVNVRTVMPANAMKDPAETWERIGPFGIRRALYGKR